MELQLSQYYNCKPNKIYVDKDRVNFTTDQGNRFCIMIMQKCIQHIMKENLLLLKDLLEPYKYITSISKNVYIYKLDDIVNKYNDISQHN